MCCQNAKLNITKKQASYKRQYRGKRYFRGIEWPGFVFTWEDSGIYYTVKGKRN